MNIIGKHSKLVNYGVISIALLLTLSLTFLGCATATTMATTTKVSTTTTTQLSTTTTTVTPTTTIPTPEIAELILATTTSTRDTGLLDLLIPMFEAQTGYKVKMVAVGSGAAITMGQKGEADVLLVHAPDSELQFIADGYGINRRLIMHNDFVIVGPKEDPAGIKDMTDPVAAMQKLADTESLFVSRDDKSGTNSYELAIWNQLGITAKGQSWWLSTGQGMGATLIITNEKNGYTISDRGTYLTFFNSKVIASVILVQNPAVMVNPYHVIQVNPDKFPDITINAAGAQAFSDFMVAPETQAALGNFGKLTYGQALFIPDAGKTEAELGSK